MLFYVQQNSEIKMDIVSYTEIKENLLFYYWRSCRDLGFSGWSPEKVFLWVENEFDGAYDLPFEKLMHAVASFALTGGWYVHLLDVRRKEILQMLSEVDLSSNLSLLSPEDADEFVTDLKILKFLNGGFNE